MDKTVVVGLDVGGTHIRIGAQHGDGDLLAFERVMRADVMDNANPGGSLAIFIADYLRRHNLTEDVGIMLAGFPSTVSRDRRTILQTPNIPAMNNVPMANLLEQALSIPVFLERDVNLIYEHDRRRLGLAGEGIGIGIYFGTGIGNAIFIDGRPLAGRDGCAGEIGHIPMIGREDLCGCGNSGCAECYASGTRLVAIRQEYYPETLLGDIFIRHSDELVILRFVDAMACVVAAEINILNPEHIVLGGGLLTMSGFPRDFFEQRIVVHTRKPFPADSLRLYYTDETQQSGVLGALSIAKIILHNMKEAQK